MADPNFLVASCLQIARMVVAIAATFLLLWSPFYLVSFVSQVQENSFLLQQNFLFTMLLTHLSGFTNSAVNPFIYAMLGDKFQTAFMVSARNFFYSWYKLYTTLCVNYVYVLRIIGLVHDF